MLTRFMNYGTKIPEGWIQCRWPYEVISLIEEFNVSEISLDHDLGGLFENGKEITGMDVLNWLEQKVHEDKNFDPPVIYIHTANSSKINEMRKIADKIHRDWVANAFE